MITSAFIDLIWAVLQILISPLLLFDNVTADEGFGLAITNATTYLANFNNVLPLNDLFLVFGAILLVEFGIGIYKIIMWVIRRIPTQS